MTTISDPLLQELWENATDQGFRESRAVFILALNERLQAAEKMALAATHLISTGSGSSDLMGAVMAYRKVSQGPLPDKGDVS